MRRLAILAAGLCAACFVSSSPAQAQNPPVVSAPPALAIPAVPRIPDLTPEQRALPGPPLAGLYVYTPTRASTVEYALAPDAPPSRPSEAQGWLVGIEREPEDTSFGRIALIASLYRSDCQRRTAEMLITVFDTAEGAEVARLPGVGGRDRTINPNSPLGVAFDLSCGRAEAKSPVYQGIGALIADAAQR